MDYPYPIKDWLDADLYPQKHSDLSLYQWSWEFLRRNPEYQKHWDIFSHYPNSSPEVGAKNGKWKGWPYAGQVLDDYYGYVSPRNEPNETFEEYQERNQDEEWEVMPYADYFCSEFKIVPAPESPKMDIPKTLDFSDSLSNAVGEIPPYEINLNLDNEIKHALNAASQCKYGVSLMFDLRKPIEKQLQEAKELLIDRRELLNYAKEYNGFSTVPQTRKRESLFPHFIRILDAVAVGASKAEIASVLYPHEENLHPDYSASRKVSKQIKRALSYRDTGYWLICQ